MNDRLISRLAPVSEGDAATLVSEHATWELADEIMRTDPAARHGRLRRQSRGRRVLVPALTTVAAGAAAAAVAIAVIAQPGTPASTAGKPPAGRTGPASTAGPAPAAPLPVTSPMQLAANATTLASRTATIGPSQWVYLKVVSTISHSPAGGIMEQVRGTHRTTESWIDAGGQEAASVQGGKVVVTSLMGSPIGWPRISYDYLNSLPTDPASLMRLIKHNLQTLDGPGQGASSTQVFDSVAALIENNPELPPRLSAALYGVLAQLPSVRLGHATSLAGNKVLSLYQVEEGYLQREILINPVTYAYAGQVVIAIRSHASTGLDGTVRVHAGELLDDEAIVTARIVDHPGEK